MRKKLIDRKNDIIKKLKLFALKHVPYDDYMMAKWRKRNPYADTPEEFEKIFDKSQPTVGILADVAHEHHYYMKACFDLKINYKVIDIHVNDWITKINESECSIFLVWPTIYKPIQKQFWDERISILVNHLQKKVFPSADLLWLYESKRRTRDWLEIYKLDHPLTSVFFNKKEAISFAEQASYPIVYKSDQGASSSGVFILKNLKQAKGVINKAFSKGINLKSRGINDRHSFYVIFQEFLNNVKEWRIIRVGDSYFCRLKGKKGDFHSGSGDIIWAKPPHELLEKTREISELFEVPNVNIDFFETEDGRFLMNEVHALWGGKELNGYELEGRYLYNKSEDNWSFEKGDFFKNRCANLRLEWIKSNWG